jgi:endo-beta-N-acetylglucosaminidase D
MKLVGATGVAVGLLSSLPQGSEHVLAAVPPTFPGLAAGYPGLPVQTSAQLSVLLAYDPAHDPDAKYFRSRLPLAQRIPLFGATQAQPRLSAAPQITNLSQYYPSLSQVDNNALYQYTRYGTSTDAFVPRFQQFQDIVGGWQGAQTLPASAYIDAAHRNGALVLGILYQPAFTGTPNFLTTDASGRYTVGTKLVDLAHYFGFDGYFLNLEETIPAASATALGTMLTAMRQQAKRVGMPVFHLQWYDAMLPTGTLAYQNQFNAENSAWLSTGECDSMFINYWWPQHFAEESLRPSADYVAQSVVEADRLGLDPFTTVYFGLDIEEENDGVHANALDAYAHQVIPVHGDAGQGVASLALFDPTQRLVRRGAAAAGGTPSASALREAVYTAERKFWTGSPQNPAVAPEPVISITGNSIQALTDPTYVPHYGVANFIAERSVIGSLPFLSRFNAGAGDHFFIDGTLSNPAPWYSLGIQDILPTWQWWVKDFESDAVPSDLLSVDYDRSTAYNGGSSLRVFGRLGPQNPTEVRLFKTRLVIALRDERPWLSVTYQPGGEGPTNLYIGLILEDDPRTTAWTSVDSCPPEYRWGTGGARDTGAWDAQRAHWGRDWQLACGPRNTNGWFQAMMSLRPFMGRTIAAISLGFKAAATASAAGTYAINIGEIAVSTDRYLQKHVSPPTGFAIERSHHDADSSSAQVRLAWDFDPEVWYYDIYRRRTADSTENMLWLGRICGDCYFIDSMPRFGGETSTILQLVAVSPAGTETVSDHATARCSWP